MKVILTAQLIASLFLQDLPPMDQAAYVCRPSLSAPAGFDFLPVHQILAGDVMVNYEDDCPDALARFTRGEGVYTDLNK